MFVHRLKTFAILLLAGGMTFAGISHFRSPAPFMSIVPSFLPYPRLLVYVSGFFEIAGGLGLLLPFSRKAAALGLIALYIAVFPANINMAIHNIPINGHHFSRWALWLRLPVQLVLIGWAWWCGKDHEADRTKSAGIPKAEGEASYQR